MSDDSGDNSSLNAEDYSKKGNDIFDSDSDDDNEEENSEQEASPRASKDKRKAAKRAPKRKRKKLNAQSFFLHEAEEAESDEEEEYDDYHTERIVDREIQQHEKDAIDQIDRRHKANREFHDRSADEIVKSLQERYRQQAIPGRYHRGDEFETGTTEVTQQSLLPGASDPKIWMVRCKPGMEQSIVRSILLKAASQAQKGVPVRLKSAFCTASKGYIYLEAMDEPVAKEAIQGLLGLYFSTVRRIPTSEMTTLFHIAVRAKPLREGQWARLRRGPCKGDLCKVVRVFNGGEKAFVQMVPRPDYSNEHKTTLRPMQRLFSAEDAKQKGHDVDRQQHRPTGEYYEVWKNDFYKNGYLYKEVTVSTFLNAENVNPRVEELNMFREKKQTSSNESDAEDDVEVTSSALLQEFAQSDCATKSGVTAFRVGDMVQVLDGELRNLVASVVSINDAAQLVRLRPLHTVALGEVEVEASLLAKYISYGTHVKVINGKHSGETGIVVSVNLVNGDQVASLLTDGLKTEITCNVNYLQVTSEVTTGLHNLQGYELYDLVILNANEVGVVIFVGTEHLNVITQNEVVKNVRPIEIRGKFPHQRRGASAFDHRANSIAPGDTVTVIDGQHNQQSGTVKHIYKSNLWLHSESYLKNSGIFVVRSKSCILAGAKGRELAAAEAAAGGIFGQSPLNATPAPARPGAVRKGGPKDANVGKTVKITKGGFKGHLAHITDATDTQYKVELHTKLKVLMIDKEKVVIVGDKQGAIESERRVDMDVSTGVHGTPYLTAETPLHGSQTPMYAGSETPRHAPGTPGVSHDANFDSNPFAPSENDKYGGSGWGSSEGWGQETDAWGSSNQGSAPLTGDGWSASNQGSATATGNGWGSSNAGWGSIPTGWGTNPSDFSQYGPRASPSQATSPWTGGADAMRNSNPVGDVTFRDWVENMIVVIVKGFHSGKQAVTQGVVGQDGTVSLVLRDSDGRLSGGAFRVHYDSVKLAEPRKKSKVMVLSGTRRGFVGVLKKTEGRDCIIDGSATNAGVDLFKLSNVAWMHEEH